MNAFDFFFENSASLDNLFLVGKEEITFKNLYNSCINLSARIEKKVGQGRHIMLISVNNLFFIKSYLAIIKSGNIVIPLDPGIEKENFKYIYGLTNPDLIFVTQDVGRLSLIHI